MKKQSRTVVRRDQSDSPGQRHLPLVDILVDTQVELQAKARQRQGFGWKRWSRQWLYDELGLFNEYRAQYRRVSPTAAPAR